MKLEPPGRLVRWCVHGLVAGVVTLLCLVWAWAGHVDMSYLLPDPAHVLTDVWTEVVREPSALATTAVRAVTGTALGLVTGALLAFASYLFTPLLPLARVLGMLMRCVPIVALTPTITLLVGYGGPAAVVTTVVMSFFPAFALIGDGLGRIPPGMVHVVRASGGTRLRLLLRVGVPMALPEFALAAKLTSALALLACVTAEFLTANDGLGALLARSQGLLDTSTVWAVLLVCLVSSLFCHAIGEFTERRVREHMSLHRS